LKSGWSRKAFPGVLRDVSGGNVKTPKSEYMVEGRYPVVDQGKNLIAGYVDDPSLLCRAALPVIVFGDHTRAFKYIDFPFCMGADGVKVLRPIVDADVKYLYYYLRSLSLTSGGYDRHFKYLKRADVILPPLPEQGRIADILDGVDGLRAKRQAALAQLDILVQSIFLDMFGDPMTNPNGWTVVPLARAVKPGTIVTYGIVQAGDEFPDGIPYIRTGDLVHGEIATEGLRRTAPEIATRFGRSRVETGDIVMSIRATVGTTAVVPQSIDGANLTQGTARIAPSQEVIGPYLLHMLRTPGVQNWIQRQVKGATFREITLARLRELPVASPPVAEQRNFALRADAVERLKHAQRASLMQFDSLFASLQQRAFRGEL
jgi:type I restriction enzyme, S subunit